MLSPIPVRKISLIFIIFHIVVLVPGTFFGFDLRSQVQTLKLSNGMTWLFVYRPQVPVFSGIVMVRAGGVDESPGKTGLAHMFEHMAFKGSKEVGTKDYAKEKPILEKIARAGREISLEAQKENPDFKKIALLKNQIHELTKEENQYMVKNEIWVALSRKGAEDLNAFTTKDATAYHASMLANQFPLWAYVTSEMVFHPVMREFYQERDVVMEERRSRYDNSADGFLIEALIEKAFPDGAYHSSPIGTPKDLVGLTMEDATDFHKRFYVPSNMVGVVVGAVTAEAARPTLEKFFGSVPATRAPQDVEAPSHAFEGERLSTVSFPAEPYLVIGFYKPKAPAREDYIFDILDELLCEGRTGKLYQKLVKEEKIAEGVSCSGGFPGSRQDNLFLIFARPIRGHALEELKSSIYKELESLSQKVQARDLEKVRRTVLYNFLWGLEDNLHLAEQLAMAQSTLRDWRYIATYTELIQSISAKEVEATAKKYFQPENRIVVDRIQGKRSK